MDKPIDHQTLAKQQEIPAEGEATDARVTLADLTMDAARDVELVQEDDRLQLVAKVGPYGRARKRRHERIPATAVKLGEASREQRVQSLKGHRPAGVPTLFTPHQAKPPRRRPDDDEKDGDRGGTIFGTDDRYLFDDLTFPWRTTGKVRTAGGFGSGVTIGPRLVLTASHVVNWDTDDEGNVGWITFTPGYFDGAEPWGEIAATRVVYWERALGLLSDEETALDYAVLVMESRIGDTVGYAGFRTYDDDWNDGAYWQYIGYPGELSSGERPAFQGGGSVSSVASHTVDGQEGYVLCHFNEFTPGQSGGSVWGWWPDEPWPRVVGVGSTIGSTAVQSPTGSTTGDNEYGGGPALSSLIAWARSNYP